MNDTVFAGIDSVRNKVNRQLPIIKLGDQATLTLRDSKRLISTSVYIASDWIDDNIFTCPDGRIMESIINFNRNFVTEFISSEMLDDSSKIGAPVMFNNMTIGLRFQTESGSKSDEIIMCNQGQKKQRNIGFRGNMKNEDTKWIVVHPHRETIYVPRFKMEEREKVANYTRPVRLGDEIHLRSVLDEENQKGVHGFLTDTLLGENLKIHRTPISSSSIIITDAEGELPLRISF